MVQGKRKAGHPNPFCFPFRGTFIIISIPQVVRDINERQARELTDAADEAKRLKEQARGLRVCLE